MNLGGAHRWFIYQRERFPVVAHGLLIAAFSFSALCYSASLRGQTWPPNGPAAVVCFVVTFFFFLQLRIADEFKDFDEDYRYRPYRPVPRGLVSLRELAVLGVFGAAIQLVLALLLDPRLGLLLAAVWSYLGLMSCEFFVGPWLRARPILYLLVHMAIIPLIDLNATACDWLPAGGAPAWGLAPFLAVSYLDGVVLELGRKIRAPADEEVGVQTYSALWGPSRAVFAWLAALALTGCGAALAARRVDFLLPTGIVLAILAAIAALIAQRFLQQPGPGRAKAIEIFSAVWTILMYLTLGVAPLLWHSMMVED